MNRLAISAMTFLAATFAAQAADLPPAPTYKEPAVLLPTFTWTGLYLGGELGWMQTDPKFTPGAVVPGAAFVASSLPVGDKQGLSYGFLAGYNYQIGQFVVGVEGDFTGWTVGTMRSTAITGDFITAQSRWGGAIRGRLGYAADHALFYLAGGAALASTKIAATTTGYSIGGDDTRWGWTIGGGVDYAFTDHWFTGLAYRYTQYDSKIFAYPIGFQNLGIVGFKQEMSDQRVTVRIGYKF
ncbi:outer membrane protein [Rhodoplanes sp. Z2-YC6860]|uniref:outer membrane protein n=1 Tax=Rhodoplanes sp. Z2-YC6860 TaxID=674703 RepID=UPI00078EC2BF|nr:outer membrane protein [Rhodoplanes sp. Z2-YC6860]AMN43657.1 outer membrane protein Omp25b [Rhodoplanes sp. Z2-YC6860]